MPRCQCCSKARASIQIRDVQKWKTADLVIICDNCARYFISQVLENWSGPLPSAQEALRHAVKALEGLGHEIEVKSEGELATWPQVPTVSELVCESCGLSFKEFHKMGRLGCAHCYDAFSAQLDPVLERIHGQAPVQHKGKRSSEPESDSRAMRRHKILVLQREMEDAVKDENYERAAELRDQIAGMTAELTK